MTIQDPVADMLTRIRNAAQRLKPSVDVAYSTFKESIAKVLLDAGYIGALDVVGDKPQDKLLRIALKYHEGSSVISRLDRVSKSSLKSYVGKDNIPVVPGFGISVVTTSQGVMSGREAKRLGIGGELICVVS